jgi:phospho-N-acetylmuramoyl-pentapeptide-transferase
MLYELFSYLNKNTDLPGMRVGEYLSFRAGAAIIVSLLIAIFFGKQRLNFRAFEIGMSIKIIGKRASANGKDFLCHG